jgi:uncharacterized membrane protein
VYCVIITITIRYYALDQAIVSHYLSCCPEKTSAAAGGDADAGAGAGAVGGGGGQVDS